MSESVYRASDAWKWHGEKPNIKGQNKMNNLEIIAKRIKVGMKPAELRKLFSNYVSEIISENKTLPLDDVLAILANEFPLMDLVSPTKEPRHLREAKLENKKRHKAWDDEIEKQIAALEVLEQKGQYVSGRLVF